MQIKAVDLSVYKGHIEPTEHPQNATTERPRTTGTHARDVRLQKLVDDMRAADVDKPIDYELNWGNPVNGSLDTSYYPLFTHVNETIFERPVYRALVDVYTNDVFIPQVCEAETPINKDPRRELVLKNVFYNFTSTKVFQLAFEYLKEIKTVDILVWYILPLQRTTRQFRIGKHWLMDGSSSRLAIAGFEHVFVGEWKGTKVDGQHSWVKYYLLEKRGAINYHGYIRHDENLAGTIQYTWETYRKPIGGFNIGTSPAFDFSLLSVCALTKTGRGCRFTIDGFPMGVTSYLQKCGNQNDTCIATAYPVN
ncbi:unnamed protein product [Anisakis simplex]|uniref:EndoU domain-containing protein n=1 Tax=Anisakis simplex TaxID=6269 RepID=A0A3P6NLK9_ANISI|nr:unnamed protein product [Anisakis simplex]